DNSAGSEKTVLKAQSEKIDSSNAGKSGSEQSAQQQSQRQSSAAQALIDSQQLPADSNLHNAAKVSTDLTGRSDTLFSNSLQAAEQRQHSGPHKVTQKSPAEQLKQSLNLLQQDAAGQLRERVSLMVRQNIQVAEIRLDPAGLGQMQIKIDMQQEQASVQFVVQQPQAKEALEQQMPRLREMLQQQGIVLSDGNVQQQSQQQERQLAQRDSNGGKQHGQHDNGADDASAVPTVQVTASVSERLVDYYA
ncbi:MAG TPA: flagellar hook-length control protein FliK, partial [Rheinheimera sp.]|nr:flagellar hook-length control protein FliK [Rheinheimera sp.]